MKPKLNKYGLPESFAFYARKYGVSKSTSRRWFDDGLDLTSESAVSIFRASKSHGGKRGNGEKEIIAKATSHKLNTVSREKGAAAALERLEEAERAAYEHFELALREGDPLTIKTAREGWLKMGESLRRYDASVEAARREAGAMLAKEEAEGIFKALAYYMRIAGRQLIIGEVKEYCAEDDPAVLCASLESLLGEQILLSISALLATSEGKMEVPAWVGAALLTDLDTFFADSKPAFKIRVKAVEKIAAGISLK